jgi:hypothetical protein
MSSFIQNFTGFDLKERLREIETILAQKFRAVRELDRFYLQSDPPGLSHLPDLLSSEDPRSRAEGLRFLLGVD